MLCCVICVFWSFNECFLSNSCTCLQINRVICKRNPEDLAILYSNRAASYLKDGNCGECVKDCNMSLELSQFNVKSLLRRAAAYEALERYRQAYVDYKTALQIDCNIAAAHDGTNRMTKALTETDGPSWREKLPPIPTVPLSVKEKLAQMSAGNATQPSPTPQQNGTTQTKKPAPSDKEIKKAQALKEEGNALVKKGEHKKAIEKYSQSLKHNPTEVTTYTNRALCYLSVKQYRDAIRDCDEALVIDSNNVKALYRRAQAHKELKVRARVFIIALQLLIPTQLFILQSTQEDDESQYYIIDQS
uniref:Translocase of outer mitochondrial membrane 34 n=1 Tax=Oreochromis niloticus TaxID=8128 RepID=A0A669CCD3_ORENI